ncbi:hypothetical protein E1N52_10365 [Paraburkholderia guartelaensis]|uniref:Uncharacterized protein n=1 Tax=Paraburkholderia guartelaensis TaxID=2546446 RepID=A0A4R5LHQ5_9BURK|nr:hypothetical protein E1N52_10365 [Paraburkholderia guartelaensis]
MLQIRLDEGAARNCCRNCGAKKNRQAWLAVSRVFGVLRVLSTLSIRQRSEIPKEVKIKLRGEHGGRV